MTLDRFESFFELLPSRAASERSWTLSRDEIEARNFDLKAVNPNAKSTEDTRTPEELFDIIESKGREVEAAIAELRRLIGSEGSSSNYRRISLAQLGTRTKQNWLIAAPSDPAHATCTSSASQSFNSTDTHSPSAEVIGREQTGQSWCAF